MLLSVEELKELSGRKNKSKIKEWLHTKGLVFLEGADGYPKVSKEYIEQMLNGSVQIKRTNKRGNENALLEMMGAK